MKRVFDWRIHSFSIFTHRLHKRYFAIAPFEWIVTQNTLCLNPIHSLCETAYCASIHHQKWLVVFGTKNSLSAKMPPFVGGIRCGADFQASHTRTPAATAAFRKGDGDVLLQGRDQSKSDGTRSSSFRSILENSTNKCWLMYKSSSSATHYTHGCHETVLSFTISCRA